MYSYILLHMYIRSLYRFPKISEVFSISTTPIILAKSIHHLETADVVVDSEIAQNRWKEYSPLLGKLRTLVIHTGSFEMENNLQSLDIWKIETVLKLFPKVLIIVSDQNNQHSIPS